MKPTKKNETTGPTEATSVSTPTTTVETTTEMTTKKNRKSRFDDLITQARSLTTGNAVKAPAPGERPAAVAFQLRGLLRRRGITDLKVTAKKGEVQLVKA